MSPVLRQMGFEDPPLQIPREDLILKYSSEPGSIYKDRRGRWYGNDRMGTCKRLAYLDGKELADLTEEDVQQTAHFLGVLYKPIEGTKSDDSEEEK